MLDSAFEFQFYRVTADFPERIFFAMDVQDVGVETLLLYVSNGKILDHRLADRALLRRPSVRPTPSPTCAGSPTSSS